jgi:hypothetical protein
LSVERERLVSRLWKTDGEFVGRGRIGAGGEGIEVLFVGPGFVKKNGEGSLLSGRGCRGAKVKGNAGAGEVDTGYTERSFAVILECELGTITAGGTGSRDQVIVPTPLGREWLDGQKKKKEKEGRNFWLQVEFHV